MLGWAVIVKGLVFVADGRARLAVEVIIDVLVLLEAEVENAVALSKVVECLLNQLLVGLDDLEDLVELPLVNIVALESKLGAGLSAREFPALILFSAVGSPLLLVGLRRQLLVALESLV